MAYHIYTTRGIVLSARPLREADRVYAILTEELGLVHASARGVRFEKSKLRGLLEPYSLVNVSLVRGKDHWRITSAALIQPITVSLYIARPLALLEKLIAGEEPHPEVFRSAEAFVSRSEQSVESETRFVAEALLHLGYMREADLSLSGKELVHAVNEGLRSSHLA